MMWLWLLIALDALILLAAYALVVSLKLYHTIYNSIYRKRYQPDFDGCQVQKALRAVQSG